MTATTLLLIVGLWTLMGAVVALVVGRVIACADPQCGHGGVLTPSTATATATAGVPFPVPAPRAEPAGDELVATSGVASGADSRS